MQRYLIFSDIHSKAEIFEKITLEDKVYFLGDMFDRGNKSGVIVDKFIDFIDNGDITIILGNHDEMVYNVLLGLKNKNLKFQDLHLWVINGGYKTFRQLFTVSEQIFSPLFRQAQEKMMLLQQPDSFIIIDYLDELYQEFDKIMTSNRNLVMYEKIMKIKEHTKYFDYLEIDNQTFLLSHSGVVDDTWSRYGMVAGINEYETIDFSIMGHWYYTEFATVDGYKLFEHLGGSFLFNRRSHVLMIDNATCNNLVILDSNIVHKLKLAAL